MELIVRSAYQETKNHKTILFERPEGFAYKPGDWIDLRFPKNPLPGGSVYSLSSSPSEPNLMVTFKLGFSPFKEALARLKPGNVLEIVGRGGTYNINPASDKARLFIAGGVGVAPFRSALKAMVDGHTKGRVRLVYFNKDDEFLFRDELDAWQGQLPDFAINYVVTTGARGSEQTEALQNIIENTNQLFYIAGPSEMVSDTVLVIKNRGVDARNIRVDSFGDTR